MQRGKKLLPKDSDFKAKMHQIRFRLGRPPLGELTALPITLAVSKRPTSKGEWRGKRGREELEGWKGRVEGKGKNGRGWKGKEVNNPPPLPHS